VGLARTRRRLFIARKAGATGQDMLPLVRMATGGFEAGSRKNPPF
jgi:hypothetical protein